MPTPPRDQAQAEPAGLPPLPSPTRRDDGATHYAEVTYAAIDGYRPLQLDLWVPAPRGDRRPPLVLWIHGGAWLTGDRRMAPPSLRPGQIFDSLLAAGLAVATIDYRHSKEASFPAQLHDAKAALRFLRCVADRAGVDADAIGIWGESAGGHLASLVALTAHRPDLRGTVGVPNGSDEVQVAVIWYGVSDVASMPWSELSPGVPVDALEPNEQPIEILLRGCDAATRHDVSPTSHIHPDAPPFLLIHGTADTVVPAKQSELLQERLTAAGVDSRLVLVPGADHVFFGCADADLEAIVDESVRFLAASLDRA